jgi:hypothetical protein
MIDLLAEAVSPPPPDEMGHFISMLIGAIAILVPVAGFLLFAASRWMKQVSAVEQLQKTLQEIKNEVRDLKTNALARLDEHHDLFVILHTNGQLQQRPRRSGTTGKHSLVNLAAIKPKDEDDFE